MRWGADLRGASAWRMSCGNVGETQGGAAAQDRGSAASSGGVPQTERSPVGFHAVPASPVGGGCGSEKALDMVAQWSPMPQP